MEKIIVVVILLILFFALIPTIGVSIASIVIGSQNMNSLCDVGSNDIMRLSVWLIVNGSCALAVTTLYVSLLFVYLLKQQFKYMIGFLVIYIINVLFIICWNIIGAVQLFDHSSNCIVQANPLWILTLIALILQWLTLIWTVFSRKICRINFNE